MTRDTEHALLILLGLHVLIDKAVLRAAASAADKAFTALSESGASLYDVVHNDAGHRQDLPGARLKPEAILAIAKEVGFPDPKLAAAIAMGESLGYVGAKNISPIEYSVGLWQINTLVHPYSPEDMRDPIKNGRAAVQIYLKKGWKPWGAYTNGRYRQFQTGVLA